MPYSGLTKSESAFKQATQVIDIDIKVLKAQIYINASRTLTISSLKDD